MWFGVNVEKRLSKGLKLTISPEVRFHRDISKVEKSLLDLSLKYKINKNFRISGGLRYEYDMSDLFDKKNHLRYNLDFIYRQKMSKVVRMDYRLRYQKKYKDRFVGNQADHLINTVSYRNKLKVKYSYNKKNKLYFSAELFKTSKVHQPAYFSDIRVVVGDCLKTKIGTFDLSFGYQKEFKSDYPLSLYFGRIRYMIKW